MLRILERSDDGTLTEIGTYADGTLSIAHRVCVRLLNNTTGAILKFFLQVTPAVLSRPPTSDGQPSSRVADPPL